jgi:hypothetical protein
MTARSELRARRLAWVIWLFSAALLMAALVLLVLDWNAIDSILTAQALFFLEAAIAGVLGASGATVRLREQGGHLIVEGADDGRGFDVNSTRRGNGLTNMEDRLDALGGTLQVASSPGNGTTLRAVIPARRAVAIG